MGRRTALYCLTVAFALLTPYVAYGQTTTPFYLQVLAVLSNDLKNQPIGVGELACFETFTGVPNRACS